MKKINSQDIFDKSEAQKKSFAEKRKKKLVKEQDDKKTSAKELADQCFTKEEVGMLEEDIFETAKNMKLTEIIDRLLEKKHCTMLTKTDKEWDCGKSGCVKDGEDFCRNINFLNDCPAFANYCNHQMIMKSRLKKKVAKKES